MKPSALIVDYSYYPNEAIAKLRSFFEVSACSAGNSVNLREMLRQVDPEVFFCGIDVRVDEKLLDVTSRLKFIVSPATGLTHIDLNYLKNRRIILIDLGEVKNEIQEVFATSELAWGLLLSVARRIKNASLSVESGTFDRTPYLGIDLSEKLLGVVGYGRLGKQVAKYGHAFGMHVIVFDTDQQQLQNTSPAIVATSFEHLLKVSDVITFHIPLNKQNTDYFNSEMISKAKPGAIVINTSRGEILDESALAESLRRGDLFGVGVDVLSGESEPSFSPDESPLVCALGDGFNVLITPHIGGWATSAVSKSRAAIVEKFLIEYLKLF